MTAVSGSGHRNILQCSEQIGTESLSAAESTLSGVAINMPLVNKFLLANTEMDEVVSEVKVVR